MLKGIKYKAFVRGMHVNVLTLAIILCVEIVA